MRTFNSEAVRHQVFPSQKHLSHIQRKDCLDEISDFQN